MFREKTVSLHGLSIHKSVKENIPVIILWLYTFAIIIIKSTAFIGLTLDNLHTSIVYRFAWQIAWNRIGFYGGFILIFLSIAFLFKKRAQAWYILIINAVFSFLLLVDIWYFRGFNTMPTLHILREGSNLNNLSDSILAMIHRIDIVFTFDIPIIFILLIIFGRKIKNSGRNIAVFAAVLVIAACTIAYIPVKNAFSDIKHRNIIIYKYDSTVTCYNLSPIGYNLYSVYSFWNDNQTIQ